MSLRTAMLNSPFSQELHELIIDNLGFDKASLKACSLVCRAFLPRSRFHLFKSLIISNNTPSTIPPSISKFVHDLKVTLFPDNGLQADLPHLTTLEIHDHWSIHLPVISESIKRSVRNLILSHSYFKTTRDFKALVSSFTKLETLSVSHVLFSSNEKDESSNPLQFATSLRTVNFPSSSGHSATLLFDWLADLDADVQVENLHAHWLAGPEHLSSLSQFLSARGQHVKNLIMSVHPFESEELTPEVIKHQLFPNCNNSFNLSSLQSLRLPDLVIGSRGEATLNINPQITHLIRHLCTPQPTATASSSSDTTINSLASPLELSIEVRIAGLHELGTDGSLEFDWEEMALLARDGIKGRTGPVSLKLSLSCDELDELPDDEARKAWRQGTEEFLVRKIMNGRTSGNAMSLAFDWEGDWQDADEDFCDRLI